MIHNWRKKNVLTYKKKDYILNYFYKKQLHVVMIICFWTRNASFSSYIQGLVRQLRHFMQSVVSIYRVPLAKTRACVLYRLLVILLWFSNEFFFVISEIKFFKTCFYTKESVLLTGLVWVGDIKPHLPPSSAVLYGYPVWPWFEILRVL